MDNRTLTHDELVKRIRAIDPLLVAAIDDVDESLLAEFARLSIPERMEWAAGTARDLDILKRP